MHPCPRSLTPIPRIYGDCLRIWRIYRKYPILMVGCSEEEKSYPYFSRRFFAKNSRWYEFIDGSGIISIEGIKKGLYAQAHTAFWDRDFKGKVEATRGLAGHIMDIDSLLKLEVHIPDFCREALMFARMAGFTEEGRLRSRIMYNNKGRDIVVLGLLKEEI